MKLVNYFDEPIAENYDQDHGGTDPVLIQKTVACLADLADGGDALEFAIGTGRIALPLAETGVRVKGIEYSDAMIARLRAKETGAPLEIVVGDMASAQVEGAFSLVFLVFNTICNLTTQDAQIACFQNAARHLKPGGRFLIETLVPPLQKLPLGETKLAFACDDDHFGINQFDVVTQAFTSDHIWMKGDSYVYRSVPFRYGWPAEFDLMAKMAGLELESRWSDWDRAPFDATSTKHISVWRKV